MITIEELDRYRISAMGYPSEPPGAPLIYTGANYGNGFLNSGLLDTDPHNHRLSQKGVPGWLSERRKLLWNKPPAVAS